MGWMGRRGGRRGWDWGLSCGCTCMHERIRAVSSEDEGKPGPSSQLASDFRAGGGDPFFPWDSVFTTCASVRANFARGEASSSRLCFRASEPPEKGNPKSRGDFGVPFWA